MDGVERDIRDVMNPSGMFMGGKRQREYSTTSDLLPSSSKLIPEFFGRKDIRDMFARKPPLQLSQSHDISTKELEISTLPAASQGSSTTEILSSTNGDPEEPCHIAVTMPSRCPSAVAKKRSAPVTTGSIKKRGKSGSTTTTPPLTGKNQQSLNGFFKPSATLVSKTVNASQGGEWPQINLNDDTIGRALRPAAGADLDSAISTPSTVVVRHIAGRSPSPKSFPEGNHESSIQPQESVHDPVESKESWSKLFTKPTAPRCEGHDESCVSLLTKKPGMNLGRSFWMCRRPLGPSGVKEKNTPWRCQTFIWCSDWNNHVANVP